MEDGHAVQIFQYRYSRQNTSKLGIRAEGLSVQEDEPRCEYSLSYNHRNDVVTTTIYSAWCTSLAFRIHTSMLYRYIYIYYTKGVQVFYWPTNWNWLQLLLCCIHSPRRSCSKDMLSLNTMGNTVLSQLNLIPAMLLCFLAPLPPNMTRGSRVGGSGEGSGEV